ncbi:putative repeat protein (TIGR03847 family) [Sphaerisporangium siamense]|uniref:Putative repeat protein (TIGR03847 family) n=1 Tax=Sphaerisporangium siamense TaxID=795645 RepID=A0A7W7DCI7_9ACTN|nr:putative repeat protein (TIGR03847 family) [Sphaerisporangium siamense]
MGLEKFQVAVLADRLDELLDEVLRRSGGTAPVPAMAPVELADKAPLDLPIEEDFRVGTMALAWDPDTAQVVIEAQEASADDEEEEQGEDALDHPASAVLRVHISAAAARAFTQRALEIVAAGRPPCPLCGQPLDAEGHICVRLNGHRGDRT